MTLSASFPAGPLVYLCANVGSRGATHRSACPVLCYSELGPLGLSVCKCGAAGSANGQTACPVCPTLRQSRSGHGHVSPLCPGASLRPSYQSGCMFLFYLLGVGLPCQFCQVLVVRGGAVCLPTPPSWFSGRLSTFQVSFIS